MDKLQQTKHAISFFEKAKTEDKELWYYPKAWSAILLEEEWEDITKRLTNWIHKRA